MTELIKPILLIGDFPEGGGSKVYFMHFLRFLSGFPNPLEVRLAGIHVLQEDELKWFDDQGIKLGVIPDKILHPKGIIKKLRLSGIREYLYFRRSRGDYEKVVVSTNLPYKWLSGCLVWKEKYFWFVHSYPQGKPSVLTRLAAPFRRLLFSRLTRQGSKFITVSNASASKLQTQYFLKPQQFPIEVIPGPGKFDQAGQVSLNKPVVLTLGQLEKWKNPEFWVRVAVDVCLRDSEAEFWWAGDGSLKKEVSELIPDNLTQRIKLLGYRTDVSKLYEDCAIYFQPSLFESQGFGVIDAMAHGIPCVVSNVGGLPESVQDEQNGFVTAFKVEEAASYILELVHDMEKRKKMGANGSKIYLENFTLLVWEQKMKKLLFG